MIHHKNNCSPLVVATSHGTEMLWGNGLRIHRSALNRMMSNICAHSPETGGILLGPVDSNDITDFYFDAGAACTPGTYSPDHVTLREKMQKEWLPSGLDMKGFGHSHPGNSDRLSHGDLRYIARILEKNPDMPWFAAPIIIPKDFRLRAWIVPRCNPSLPREVQLIVL